MKKLLIVIDMQNDFVDGALGTPEAQSIVPNVVRKIESWDGDICRTMDSHDENYLQSQEGQKLPVPHCIVGSDGWRMNPAVLEALSKKGYTSLLKPTFGCVSLIEHIDQVYGWKNLERIELVGLCTDICVVSNALLLKAFYPELPISVDASCCAGVTPESHKAALTTMKMCQIEVTGEAL